MSLSSQRRGFNCLELMVVLVVAGVLLAIGLPRFHRAQTHARQSEAITNLKSLHASMSLQQSKPYNIHVPGFDPPRGNRYSYSLEAPCSSAEDRSSLNAMQNMSDRCIAVDTFAHPTFPWLFNVSELAAASWDGDATSVGVSTQAGIYGICEYPFWDYLAYAAGDVDDDVMDTADTWAIASADGELMAMCPIGSPTLVPAGEPFMVVDDADCN
ncbi:prepilin-type N-terminal cleavage/methylation domain-containing protein [Hyalangium rubrum]|uniref:Prepilin-type N-terminal cleavage/methylation domain-containing protein n=1 Tax=Hyalangium rubrum TaxID=3103134 RepID=A0ABU5H4A9_9BACT|nr:prepilin-type N-terminal cleavage/methylation domain-containing protein [Hyalangium sp. s54d21]MDY7228076.1 prepilin-type N-terminal cleavage/methylation domain-containing protein [Hyalangium sp. s54d21]